MTETERLQIIALVKNEVVPAIGCTEPIAVALCVAKAVEVLNKRPEKITEEQPEETEERAGRPRHRR